MALPIRQPDPVSRQQKVTRIILTLLGNKGLKQKDIAAVLGVGADVVTKKKNRGGWTLADLDALADLFKVDPAIFFADPDDVGFRTGNIQTLVALDQPAQLDLSLPFRPPLHIVPT